MAVYVVLMAGKNYVTKFRITKFTFKTKKTPSLTGPYLFKRQLEN
jgi:hypothetical protein